MTGLMAVRNYIRLIFWANIWLIIWICISPFRKGRDNCLTHALEKWANEGGYLVIRWARNSKTKWLQWPHFLWLDEQHHVHLEHVDSGNTTKRAIPQFWFYPVTKRGDYEDGQQ